jgi:hypothetical protein
MSEVRRLGRKPAAAFLRAVEMCQAGCTAQAMLDEGISKTTIYRARKWLLDNKMRGNSNATSDDRPP